MQLVPAIILPIRELSHFFLHTRNDSQLLDLYKPEGVLIVQEQSILSELNEGSMQFGLNS